MKKIELKVDKEYFEQILSGSKNFEIRLGDKNIEIGDMLVLLERDPLTKKLTSRKIEKIVTVLRNTKDINHWPRMEIEKYGLQIIGFK